MSSMPCPHCGRELIRPYGQESLLSVCSRCGFSGCMLDDIADEYRDEVIQEHDGRPVKSLVVSDSNPTGGVLF